MLTKTSHQNNMQDKIEDTYAEGYTADLVETLSQASVVAKKEEESVVETKEKSKIRKRKIGKRRDKINNEKN